MPQPLLDGTTIEWDGLEPQPGARRRELDPGFFFLKARLVFQKVEFNLKMGKKKT